MTTLEQIRDFVDLGYNLCIKHDCDEVELTPYMRKKLGQQEHLLNTVIMEVKRRRYNMPSIYQSK